MAPSPFSRTAQAALHRLAQHIPPPTLHPTIPHPSRASVLLLLYPSLSGSLRIVLTQRSSHLRSFPNQVALPGGHAEPNETAFQTARREAWEEVGLPMGGSFWVKRNLMAGKKGEGDEGYTSGSGGKEGRVRIRVEEVGELECNVSRNGKIVRPCIAVMVPSVIEDPSDPPDLDHLLLPHLQQNGEVSEVFTADLERFLVGGEGYRSTRARLFDGREWIMHEFKVPKKESRTGFVTSGGRVEMVEGGEEEYYTVWGMTARILVDAARIAFGRDPEFEFVKEVGMEKIVENLVRNGKVKGMEKKVEGKL